MNFDLESSFLPDLLRRPDLFGIPPGELELAPGVETTAGLPGGASDDEFLGTLRELARPRTLRELLGERMAEESQIASLLPGVSPQGFFERLALAGGLPEAPGLEPQGAAQGLAAGLLGGARAFLQGRARQAAGGLQARGEARSQLASGLREAAAEGRAVRRQATVEALRAAFQRLGRSDAAQNVGRILEAARMGPGLVRQLGPPLGFTPEETEAIASATPEKPADRRIPLRLPDGTTVELGPEAYARVFFQARRESAERAGEAPRRMTADQIEDNSRRIAELFVGVDPITGTTADPGGFAAVQDSVRRTLRGESAAGARPASPVPSPAVAFDERAKTLIRQSGSPARARQLIRSSAALTREQKRRAESLIGEVFGRGR